MIRTACEVDLPYVFSLARKHSEALGFLPPPALEQYMNMGSVWLCQENSAEAGFLVLRHELRLDQRCAAIIQACVQTDAQRRHHGLAMVAEAAAASRKSGRTILQCWCAADLESNDFWRAAGFAPMATRDGGRRRNRQHILWRLALQPTADLSLVISDPRRPVSAAQPIIPPRETQGLLWPGDQARTRLS
jgi:hypothetical protein